METNDMDTNKPGDARNIQSIDKQSVHRICSGQVVLNLATAVKELVENSLDAGANSIDVRLREYGSELMEVIDNGSGVKQENFEGLTLKHHTSKLRDFNDLVAVDTFGFRGEALSSLCALSKLMITTCHKETAVGTKLDFDHSGKLLSKSPCARQTGTTVSLQNLFSTLPVRHKEFQRNLKKEFNRMVQVLYAYCIVSTSVRISCTNQLGKGKKNVMVNTNGNNTIKENIANLFGAKQTQNILEFVQTDPSEEMCTEYRITAPTHKLFSISGYVSTCEHGHGRSSSDRQFYFINKRPCDLIKVSRVVNEVYHYYNRHQYPFVVMDISLDKESVDVNVTPDKRQIFIENEKLLLAVIKSSLVTLWQSKASLFQLNQAQTPAETPLTQRPRLSLGETSRSSPNLSGKQNISSSLANMKRSFSSAFAKNAESPTATRREAEISKPNKQRKLDAFIMTPDSGKLSQRAIDLKFAPVKPLDGVMPSSPQQSTPDTGIEVSPHDTTVSDMLSNSDTPRNMNSSEPDLTSQNTPRSMNLSECDLNSQNTPRSMNSSNDDLNSSPQPGYNVVFEDPLCFTKDENCEGVCHEENKELQKSEKGDHGASREIYNEEDEECKNNHNGSNVVFENYQSLSNTANSVEGNYEDSEIFGALPKTYNKSDGINNAEFGLESSLVSSGDLKCSFPTKDQNTNKCSVDISDSRSSSCNNADRDTKTDTEEEIVEAGYHKVCETLPVNFELHSRKKENKEENTQYLVTITEQDEPCDLTSRRERRIPFSMSQLKSRLQRKEKCAAAAQSEKWCRSFRAKINPGDNTAAEEELKREISKDRFLKMKILGQFNLGFIIGQLERDLFIIDQHATDEKYNFEMLQRHTVIQSQKLIQPQSLELTAASEVVLIDNLQVFHKNGFDFQIDEEAIPTQRVKLVSMPVSKNWTFGKDDIDELLFMLSDTPGVHCRPSRVRMMFASRSCRKSVMIGTALDKPQMRKLIDHMAEIDQPWNCPHGRPTMRHLINLDMLPQ